MYLSLLLAIVMLGLSQGAPVADAEADASPGPFFFEVEAHDMMLRYNVHPEEALSLMHDINNTQVAFDSSNHTDDSPESAYLTGKWKNEIYQPMVAEVDRAFEAQWLCILTAMFASAAYALNSWIRKTCGCCQTPNEDKMVVKVEGAKE